MSDSLLVVEAYLDQESITHHRDDEGTVIFHIPYGRTSYDCRIRCDGPILVLAATWNGVILVDDAELAERVLVRLSNVGSGSGKTFFNPAQRALKFETSVDVSMSTLTPERVRIFLETVLDPFNIKILAMEFVLDGQLPADVAVDIRQRCWSFRKRGRCGNRFFGCGTSAAARMWIICWWNFCAIICSGIAPCNSLFSP